MPDYANPQDLNRYSYVRGNPLRFTDPSGHAVECGVATEDCGTPMDGETVVAIYKAKQWKQEKYLVLPRMGFPTVIGVKIEPNGGFDVALGESTSTGTTVAYNWVSGELSLLSGYSISSKFGTPDGMSGNVDIKLFFANGATENKSLTGPSDIETAHLTFDEWGKLGLVYEDGYAVKRELGASRYPGGPKQLIPVIDQNSQREVKFWAIGLTAGLNVVANAVDFNWGRSPGPGFNDTSNLVIYDFNRNR